MHASGGLFFAPKFTLLIYPTGSTAWNFVSELFPSEGPPAALRFLMRAPIVGLNPNSAAQHLNLNCIMENEGGVNALFHQYFNIEYIKLVPQIATKKDENPNTFFLMYPPIHSDEHDVLINFLTANNATIYSAHKPGDWDHFTSSVDAGAVLVSTPAYNSILRVY